LADSCDDYVEILNDLEDAYDDFDKESIRTNKNYQKLTNTLSDLLDIEEDMVDIDLVSMIDPKDL
jgi:hypothetical protein